MSCRHYFLTNPQGQHLARLIKISVKQKEFRLFKTCGIPFRSFWLSAQLLFIFIILFAIRCKRLNRDLCDGIFIKYDSACGFLTSCLGHSFFIQQIFIYIFTINTKIPQNKIWKTFYQLREVYKEVS